MPTKRGMLKRARLSRSGACAEEDRDMATLLQRRAATLGIRHANSSGV